MLLGAWGERKRDRAGHDGKVEERREASAFSLFPSSSVRFQFFRLLLFYRDTRGEPLRRRESFEASPLVAQWSCMFRNFPGFMEEGDNIHALFLAWGLFLESPGNSSGQKSNICCGSILSLV